jgi:tripartite-type tricarboxylate transporter receptor subunit TctC
MKQPSIPQSDRRRLCRRAFASGAFVALGVWVLPLLTGASSASAQTWPSGPVRLVIPFPPGGATDVIGRQLGIELAKRLGQQVIVDNRPGASGTIGARAVVAAPPDGYTLLLATPNTASGDPALEKLGYNPATDLAPIAAVAAIPYVIFANPAFPPSNIAELIAAAKAAPGKINFASSGAGGPPHLASELLKARAAIDVTHIPYKGAVPAVNDVVGGQVQFMTGDVNTAIGFIKSGRLKALATTGPERLPLLPDVPTVAESGLAGFQAEGWFAVLAPARIASDLSTRLHAAVSEAVQDPDFRKRMEALGGRPLVMDRQAFGRFIADERETRARLIRDNKIVIEN